LLSTSQTFKPCVSVSFEKAFSVLDCINRAVQWIARAIFATYLSVQFTTAFQDRCAFKHWNGSFLSFTCKEQMAMNVPAIIALTAIVTSLLVASCLYICKKRYVEPLEATQQKDALQ